jgi:hypothetical protein
MTGRHPTPSTAHSGVERFDALILDASLRQSLVSVRSLGKRGLCVAALDAVDGLPAFSSRWCRKAFICPAAESAGYAAHLRALLDRTRVGVLVPSSDRTLASAVRHRGRPEVASPLAAVVGFGMSFFQVMSYDYLDWSDPVPAAIAIAAFVREAANIAFTRAFQ